MEIVFRPIRSSLELSLKECVSFDSFNKMFDYFKFKGLNSNGLVIKPYCKDIDSRCWWNETHLLLYRGKLLGFVGTR